MGQFLIWKGEYMLVDQHNRRFTYLRLSITDVCNFRCNYCLPDGYSCEKNAREQPLTPQEIKKLAYAFALNGTQKIRITGGEPTLRKDLNDIIAICKSTPGINTVSLTSNGYRLSKQLDSYIDSGLDALNISADSLNADTFKLITGHNSLDEILKTIDLAIARGMKKIKVNTVLLKEYSYKELQSFLNFVKDLPITLRFIELMQTGDNQTFFEQQHVSGSTIQQMLLEQDWLQIIREPNAGPAVEYTHPDYAGNIGLIMPYSKNFCNSCNRLRVSADGNMHLCLFADDNAPLRPHLLSDSTDELAQRIRNNVLGKQQQHLLQEGYSGSTRHLAMLGG